MAGVYLGWPRYGGVGIMIVEMSARKSGAICAVWIETVQAAYVSHT